MIGILDWGIGGEGTRDELRRRRPDLDLFYIADNGSTPYGMMSRRDLTDRVAEVVSRLASEGCSLVAIACNAASTVVDDVARRSSIPILGIIDAGVAAVEETDHHTIGVVGGARTIRSGIYRRRLEASGRTVRSRIAQPLSGMIERGEETSDRFGAELRRIIDPLRDCDALLLACTHYPRTIDRFRAEMPGVTMIDPAERLVDTVLSTDPPPGAGVDRYLRTG